MCLQKVLRTLSLAFRTFIFRIGAEGGTRTPTGYPTRPSNVRVYQFRHFGLFRKVVKDGRHARLATSSSVPASL